jgi:crotonobetainyl-CoA:carnitine CoA-transferase CaiB-like acyl-CoA transferase
MTEIRGPLAGVRVLDATSGIAGPVATMLLADFGAEVIRIDDGVEDVRALPGAIMWHRNKTLVSEAAARPLLADADIVVTSDDSRAEQLGLAVTGADPSSLVHLHLPIWQPRNVAGRQALDAMTADRMVQADYGIARRQTSFHGGPVECVYPFASYLQGAWGAAAGIATLIERVKTGLGQRVTVDSLHGAVVAATTTMFADPKVSLPTTSVGPGGPNPAFGTYQCGDGQWIFLGALGVKFQDIAFGVLGVTDILEHPRIAANREEVYAVDLRDQVRARIADGFRAKTRDQWLEELAAAGCPVSPVGDRDDWLDHPQVIAMNQRVELDDPLVGRAVMGGVPVTFSDHPNPVHRPRAIASDTVAWTPREHPPAEQATGDAVLPGSGPLHGLRVLDLGTTLAGPYAGQLLASLGADVVKVETPRGDEFRVRGYMINRGQRSLSIDLRNARGKDAFLRLVQTSDVVVDNFRPGVRARLGVDIDSLRTVNPDVVTTSITGYGGIGPMGDHPGYDPVVQALSGIMRAQGGDAEPVFCTVAVNDVASACLAALGTCAALYQRAVGRGGQEVGTSLAASAVFMQSNELVRYRGRPPAETGGRDYPGATALARYYRCSDGWVRLHLPSAKAAVDAGLAATDGLDDAALAEAIAKTTADLSVAEVDRLVAPVGGFATHARDNKEFLFSPEHQHDGHIGTVVWPDGHTSYLPRSYATFGRHRSNPMMTTPGMGEHTREVLVEAGVDEDLIDELITEGVLVEGGPLTSVAGTGYR